MSFSLLNILGALFCMVLCNATPTPSPGVTSDACRNSSAIHVQVLGHCIYSEFTPDKFTETARVTNDTGCLICKHLCRKQETLLNCFRTFTDSSKDLSNKSSVVVPFLGRFFEEAVTTFCEHEAEMISGFSQGENGQCYIESRRTCKSHLRPLHNTGDLVFCDSDHSDIKDNSQKLICQFVMEFLQCSRRTTESCTEDVQNTHASITSLFRNSEACGKYL